MKKLILPALSLTLLVGCDTLNQVAGEILTTDGSTTSKATLTNTDVIAGLKSALNVAINNAVSSTSVTDGFNTNNLIRLPFPEDAIAVKNFLKDKNLLQGQVARFETTLNRAAEDATKTAAPIFLDAIKNMSIADGFAILNGGEGAATKFLKDKTTSQLVAAFSPKAKESIEKVELTKYWNPLTSAYNKSTIFTGKEKVNTNLDQYVTNKAIDGLFTMMTAEENKIRKDPVARVNDILKKVFGSLDK